MSVTTTDTDQTIKCLDGFYCANVVASLWAAAVLGHQTHRRADIEAALQRP